MSSGPSAASLQLQPERSRILLVILIAGHGAAFAMLPLIDWPMRARLPVAGLLLLSLLRALRIHWFRRGPRAIHGLTLDAAGIWTLRDGRGREQQASMAECFVHPWLIVIHFRRPVWRGPGPARTVLLFPDTAHEDTLRGLRVRLRQMPAKSATGP